MSNFKDLTGLVFNHLTVTHISHFAKHRCYWLCKCDCGNTHTVSTSSLKSGDTKSCGCIKKNAAIKAKTTHGMSHIPEYLIWQKMVYRCRNKNDKSYNNYGGRGITVCERWKISFENFIKDMGLRPTNSHSLERKNNNGAYSENNCRWATRSEQNRNKRNNKFLTYDGKTMILADWARHLNITHSHLQFHLNTKSMSEVYNYFIKRAI